MSTWHAPPDLLARYARAPEAIEATTASSIEQHLLACGDCRASVADASPAEELARSWASIEDVVDRPRPALLERILTRAGLAEDTARLVGATSALQLAWLAVVLGLTIGALAASANRGSASPFLALAPLLPVGAVAVAFVPTIDPAGETGIATALHGFGATMRRVLATAGPTSLVLVAASPALPTGMAAGAAWVLPAVALASLCLLLTTVVRVPVAFGAAALAWVGTLWLVPGLEGDVALPRSATFAAGGQLAALGVATVALAAVVVRRERFATMEVGW